MKKWGHWLAMASISSALVAVSLGCGDRASTMSWETDDGSTRPEDSGEPSGVPAADSSGAAPVGRFTQGDSGGMGTGVCQTGMYSGAFSCNFVYDPDAQAVDTIDGGADAGPFSIMGMLSLALTQSVSGELGQDTANGTFVVDTGFATTGMATLSGTLDCATGKFTGSLTNGTYSVFFSLFTGSFEGPLTSDYNGKTFSFVNGSWSLTIPGEGYCPGSWSANYVDQ
jgi:hypothetical protein